MVFAQKLTDAPIGLDGSMPLTPTVHSQVYAIDALNQLLKHVPKIATISLLYNLTLVSMHSLTLQIPKVLKVTDEQFQQFVTANPTLRLERTAVGELIVMPPTGSEGGSRNAELTTDITIWNRQTNLGIVFDSSTGFKLANGAIRSPDTAWIRQERWAALTPEERKGYAPICPDFVLELLSETDQLENLQAKMQEYLENGCRLGWLIDPKTKRVEIYRAQRSVEVLQAPVILSGESVLPGFVLSLGSFA